MLTITFAALCVAVISAESSSISSYSGGSPSNARDYEYSGAGYVSSGNNKPMYTETYITTGGGSSPYAKSDSRYSTDSNGDSSDPRTGITSSYYKSKYGSEAVVNSLRPSSFHSSPSSSASSSGGSSDLTSNQVNPSHYSSADYGSSHPSSSSSAPSHYEGGSSSAAAADYTALAYGDRSQHHQQQQQYQQQHISGPVYSSQAAAELAATGANAGHSEYSSGRPAGSVYSTGYAGSSGLAEYTQSRPTSYSHSSGPSSISSSDYQTSHPSSHAPHYHQQQHHHHAQHPAYASDEPSYPSQPMHPAPSHPYKTYVMSSPSSYSPSKYQSVFGALKSLFGGGSDVSPSASHAYPSGPPSYYSPSMMHAAAHHPAPSAYSGASVSPAMSSGGSGYYFGPGPAASSSVYSKNYPSMRFVSGYGMGGSTAGSKVIVVRDSGSALHGPGYPSSASSGLIGSPSSYITKSKLSAFAPSGPGHAYISASPSSMQSYSSGPPSSYPGYTSSPSFSSSGHGGSTFLGYSA